MEILTWNIQSGLGVDGRVDLGRIENVVREMRTPDVICFQEIARNMPVFGPEVLGDQVAELQERFSEYDVFFGPVFDANGENAARQQFGNLMMSRIPVHACRHHLLPRPAASGVHHMPRQATELLVEADGEFFRIVGTHLEYFVTLHRAAQVERLICLHRESCENARKPSLAMDSGPYSGVAGTCQAVFCGDFNFRPEDLEYEALTCKRDDYTPALMDAWSIVHGGRPHDPTCGIFDHVQWTEGSHCRDFFFVSENLAERVEHIRVQTDTDASDHQPLEMRIAAP